MNHTQFENLVHKIKEACDSTSCDECPYFIEIGSIDKCVFDYSETQIPSHMTLQHILDIARAFEIEIPAEAPPVKKMECSGIIGESMKDRAIRLAINSFQQACAAYVYSVMVDTGNYFPNKRPLFFRELQKIIDGHMGDQK